MSKNTSQPRFPVPRHLLGTLLTTLVLLLAAGDAAAQGFDEDFASPTLDPEWSVVTFTGPRFYGFTSPANDWSLTASSGHLRYILHPMTHGDGYINGYQKTFGYHSCCDHDPGLELHRPFGGTHWTFETKVSYHMPFANGRHVEIRVYFGDGGPGTYYANFVRGRDVNPFNAIYLQLVQKTGSTLSSRVYLESPPSRTLNPPEATDSTHWFRLRREGGLLTAFWSDDGTNWTLEWQRDLGAALDNLDQRVVVTGLSWFLAAGSYIDYDYIRVTPGRSVLSPVAGDLGVVTADADCPPLAAAGKWCFNQHQGASHAGNGVGGADDRYAWDANLNSPVFDADDGRPVYAAAPGVVAATYGGSLNADPRGSEGQVLIEHQTNGVTWWSGYLHMDHIRVRPGQAVQTGTWLGRVADVGAPNPHLHFVTYEGQNVFGGLASVDAALVARPDGDGDAVPDGVDLCPAEDASGLDANADGCLDTAGALAVLVQSLGLPPGQQTALLTSLRAAEAAIARSNRQAALGELNAFVQKVQAQRGKSIPDGDADLLIEYASNTAAQI
ncbi:MAG TPA: M23 family metallopeptidase [Thermoanaerobaculia bacterium]